MMPHCVRTNVPVADFYQDEGLVLELLFDRHDRGQPFSLSYFGSFYGKKYSIFCDNDESNEAVGISFLPAKASWWSLKAIIVYGKTVYYSL